MSTSRKRHSKSRKGCTSCKQRHTKCDELHPICSTCKRLDLQCIYPKDIKSPRNNNHLPTQRYSPLAQTPAYGYSILDLELMHHWSICPCIKIASGTDGHRCWVKDVPKVAFSHSYVLDQLLAVSALHVMSMDPSRTELKDYAIHHRAQALENVQSFLRANENTSAIPLFAFAGLASIHAFAELAITPEKNTLEFCAVTQITSCFRLLRGTKMIINAHREKLEESWASSMLDMDASKDFAAMYATGLGYKQTEYVSNVIRMCSGLTKQEIDDHISAFGYCMNCIALLTWRTGPRDENYYLVMAWPTDISDTFLSCLDRKEPASLVVLAHYAVLMNIRQHYWWFDGWAASLFARIEFVLDDDWREHLQWPRERLAATPWISSTGEQQWP